MKNQEILEKIVVDNNLTELSYAIIDILMECRNTPLLFYGN